MRVKKRIGRDGHIYITPFFKEGDTLLIEEVDAGLLIRKAERGIILRKVATRGRLYLKDLLPGESDVEIEPLGKDIILIKRKS